MGKPSNKQVHKLEVCVYRAGNLRVEREVSGRLSAARRRGQLRKCAARWQRRWLREAFARWRAGVALQRARRCLLQRGLIRHAGRRAGRCLAAWAAYARHRRHLRLAEVRVTGLILSADAIFTLPS